MREACDQAHAKRIGNGDKNHRDRFGRLLGSERRRRTPCQQDIDLEVDQFLRQVRKPINPAFGKPILDANVFAFDVAQIV
jgi:hypothetical protein